MRLPTIVLALVTMVAFASAGRASGDPAERPSDEVGVHPALRPFGATIEDLPAEIYLVRTRGELPAVPGIQVHGARGGVFLVSGEPEAVAALERAGCAVIPVAGLPAATRAAPRQWKMVTAPDPAIAAMVDEVSWDRLATKIQWLVDFGTRYSYAANHQDVADAIGDAFADIGLTPVLRSFQYNGATMWNVEATQPGTVYPDSFFIICGHFDSYSESPMVSAPGADDNGTGTAAVLTAAEILAPYDFQYSIRYICFGGEEQGLRGSQVYAQWAAQNDLGIAGVLNFDMIGYWEEGVEMDLEIETNHASQWLAAAIVNAADLYVGVPYQLHVYDGAWWGDHASFWNEGFAAVNHEEAWDWADPDFNPYYHSTQDLLAYVSPDFTIGNVQIGVAALATLALLDTTASAIAGVFPPWPAGSVGAHPNPFNQRVTFTVTGVPDRDMVRVIIYDVRGGRVDEVPVPLHLGRGSASWDLSRGEFTELSSGVYFVRLEGLPAAAPSKLVYIK